LPAPYALAGFDLTAHSSASRDDSTRPRRQGYIFYAGISETVPHIFSYRVAQRVLGILIIRDRCYDFKNIFAEKFGEKIGIFDSKQS
jgi:hypothetical protein